MNCQHHWKIPAAEGIEVRPEPLALTAACKRCGDTREFLLSHPKWDWSRLPKQKNPLRLPG